MIALAIYGYAYLAPQPVGADLASDKLLHATGSGLLFLSLFVATHERLPLWLMAILACVIGFAFEYAQSFSVMRHFDWADAGLNVVGVAAGAIVILLADRAGLLSPDPG